MVKQTKQVAPELELIEYTPEQCGWVRVKRYDRPGTKAYEQPNGKMYYFSETQRAKVPKLRSKN